MRILCVAEKPSIAKSIASILSRGSSSNRPGKDKYCRNYDFQYRMPGVQGMVDMTMTSVRGHLTESDFTDQHKKWYSCSPSDLFQAPIVTDLSSDGKSIGQNLRLEARNADALMIWTDCDREGEHIGSEIVNEVRKVKRNIRVMRARFSAIIDNQIHAACQNTVDLDWRAANAVEARIELDLRIGAAFTRMQTLGLQNKIPALGQEKQVISYGPCQFPTLGFVVDRYEKVIHFVPEPFWTLQIHKTRSMNGGDPSPDDPNQGVRKVVFNWDRVHLFDKKAVEILRDICKADLQARVEKVTSKQTKKFKPYPLTTVELQKSGSRLLRMAPKKILDIAESLYQKGFLSYPRTETDQYDKDFDFHSLINKQTADGSWGQIAQRLVDGEFERPRSGKQNDKAHPPIHPTAHANNLSGDDKRVYDYVTRRFLASCWKDAIGTQTTVGIDVAGEKFHAAGLIILQRNYLEVFIYDKWEGTLLPPFVQGELFTPTKLEMKSGSTAPPKLLTEADLVNLMDKNGIGTDATIAEHIAKVIDRRYVMQVKEGKTTYLVPSTLGIGLVEGYNRINFEKSLSKPLLRRETEFRMSLICAGQRSKTETVTESIEEYRAVFALASRQFDILADTVLRYLTDPNAGQEARAVQLLGRDEDDGEIDDNDSDAFDDDDDDRHDRPPTGRGRGRGRGTAASTTSTRARGARGGRGGTTGNRRNPRDDTNDDFGDGGGGGGGGGAGRGNRDSGASRGASSVRPQAQRNTVPETSTLSSSNDPVPAPTCGCGETAVERTVHKSGPNQGRKFFSCSKMPGDASKCDFFEWADLPICQPIPGTSAAAKRSVPAKRPSTGNDNTNDDENNGWSTSFRSTNAPNYIRNGSSSNSGPGVRTSNFDSNTGKKRCGCDLEATTNVVYKEGPNKGRRFWCCARESVRLRCGFFEWADEDDGPEGRMNGGASSNSGAGGGASGSGSCFKCGMPGHWAPNCPGSEAGMGAGASKRTKTNGEGARGRGKGQPTNRSKAVDKESCFKCGRRGHWSSDCPST